MGSAENLKETIIIHGHIGNDREIASAAWTSTIDQSKKETKSDEEVKRVVQMLIRDKHTSPLECVVITFLYQLWDSSSEHPVEQMETWKEDLTSFRHVVIHELKAGSPLQIQPDCWDVKQGKYTWMITINFHALMKYKDKHYLFQKLYDKVKEEGFVKYAIEQIENG